MASLNRILESAGLSTPDQAIVTARALIKGTEQPKGQADPETTTRIFNEYNKYAVPQFIDNLPYAQKVLAELIQAGLLEDMNPDHVANRHYLDKTVSPLDDTGSVPQFALFSGRRQTAVPLAMLGMQNVGAEMQYPDRAASGQGQIRKEFESEAPLPRTFTSEQDLEKLPETYKFRLRKMQRDQKKSFTQEDWQFLIRIDNGEKLSEVDCMHVAHKILPKIYSLKHVVNPAHAAFFREQEANGDKRAEYTANAYDNGQRINHFAFEVSDVAEASKVLKNRLELPMVPDQGIGTPLQQTAVQSMGHLTFLELIHRDPVRDDKGNIQLQGNGWPKRIENAFNLNANAIFAATAKAIDIVANAVFGKHTGNAVAERTTINSWFCR